MIIVKIKIFFKFCVFFIWLFGCERNLLVGGEIEYCGREVLFLFIGEKIVNCVIEFLVLNIFFLNGVFCLYFIYLMSFIKKI